jgi:hypothetical protein
MTLAQDPQIVSKGTFQNSFAYPLDPKIRRLCSDSDGTEKPSHNLSPPTDETAALWRAAQLGRWSLFTRALARNRKDILLSELDPECGATALHWAALNGRFEMTQYLLQLGANPNVRGGPDSATPLHWAAV